ncbi:MAG: hypothetical protein U5K53_06540 [Halanaerobiales bacterium]|nr:hypothetical protein [Halanaerobiales bacterium]
MILSIILYIFLILFILVILAISIPYNYYISTSYQEYFEIYAVINTFLFKVVFIKNNKKEESYFKILGFKKSFSSNSNKKVENLVKKKIKDKVKKEKKKEIEDKKDKDKKKFTFSFIKSLITKENIKHVFNFLKDILNLIKPDKFKTDLLIGFDDPYNNGILSAYYYTLKSIYPKTPINITINWEEEKYNFKNVISGSIRPLSLFIRIILFIFSIPVIKTGVKIIKYKRS